MAQRSPGWCSEQVKAVHGRGLFPTGRAEVVTILEEESLAGRMQPVSHRLLSRPRNISWPISLAGQWDCSSQETVLSCCGTTVSAAPGINCEAGFFCIDVVTETIQV